MLNKNLNYKKIKDVFTDKSKIFPYVVINNFFSRSVILNLLSDKKKININSGTRYLHFNENKLGISDFNDMPSNFTSVINFLNSKKFIRIIEKCTGFKKLLPDPLLNGGGIHITKKGGYLEPHLDFRTHPVHKNWKRVLNLIIYLNEDWINDYNGQLILYNKYTKSPIKKNKTNFKSGGYI